MDGRQFGYARVSVARNADANNLENQRRLLDDCEEVFEDVGSGASWNRPGLNRLKTAFQPGDCVKVTALDRLGRSLTEVLDRQAHWPAQGSQPEAGRGDSEYAPARRPLVGSHRHDNRVAFQQHPPDLHLESRRDSAVGFRRMITWLSAHRLCHQTDTSGSFYKGSNLPISRSRWRRC